MDEQHTEVQGDVGTALQLSSAKTEVTELRASLSQHVRLAEALVEGKTDEQRIALGRGYFMEMQRHKEWALCKAAYLGVTLKSLFQGRNDKAKERICNEVAGYSLSEGRRFVKFVENLPTIQREAEKRGQSMEALGFTKCLALVPKQKGRGGRPPKGGRQQDAPSADTQPEAANAAVAKTSCLPCVTAPLPSGDNDENVEPPATQEAAEFTVTILSTFRLRRSLAEIKDRLANKQATLRLVGSRNVLAVGSEEVLAESDGGEILEWRWSDAQVQAQDAQVGDAGAAVAPDRDSAPNDNNKYFE